MPVLAGEMGGQDLALDPAVAEAARDEDARHAIEPVVQVVVGQRLRIDPAHLGVDPCAQAAWRSASVTDRYASGSSMYLPTSAISRTGLGALIRSTSARHEVEVGLDGRVAEAELADDQPAEARTPRT